MAANLALQPLPTHWCLQRPSIPKCYVEGRPLFFSYWEIWFVCLFWWSHFLCLNTFFLYSDTWWWDKKRHPSLALGNWQGRYRNELRNMFFPPSSSPHSQAAPPVDRHLGEGRKIGTLLSDTTSAKRPGGRKGGQGQCWLTGHTTIAHRPGGRKGVGSVAHKGLFRPWNQITPPPHTLWKLTELCNTSSKCSLFLFLIVSQKLVLLLENRSEIQMLISR